MKILIWKEKLCKRIFCWMRFFHQLHFFPRSHYTFNTTIRILTLARTETSLSFSLFFEYSSMNFDLIRTWNKKREGTRPANGLLTLYKCKIITISHHSVSIGKQEHSVSIGKQEHSVSIGKQEHSVSIGKQERTKSCLPANPTHYLFTLTLSLFLSPWNL